MPNRLPLPGFLKILEKINPNVIHLHFIYQDMLALEQLEKLPYPLLIDLHDTLSFNPTDPYPGQDLRFMTGLSKANSNWMERYIFFRKKHLVDTKHPFFVGPSNWICNLFSQSLIGHGLSAQCIPNIIDPNFNYNPMMRRPHKDFTILFGASGGRSATLKGWNDLWESLLTLPDNTRRKIVINIFGENDADFVSEGIRIHFLGRIRDPQEMCRQHHLADIFALPSKEDNAPQTKFEALSCGLPVIAFDRTGCAEFITHKVNGWIAPNGDLNSYATGILHYMDLYASGLLNAFHAKIADEAKNLFSNDAIVRKMLSFYSIATPSYTPVSEPHMY